MMLTPLVSSQRGNSHRIAGCDEESFTACRYIGTMWYIQQPVLPFIASMDGGI